MRHFRHLCFSSCPPPPRLDLSLLLIEEGLFFFFVLPVFPFWLYCRRFRRSGSGTCWCCFGLKKKKISSFLDVPFLLSLSSLPLFRSGPELLFLSLARRIRAALLRCATLSLPVVAIVTVVAFVLIGGIGSVAGRSIRFAFAEVEVQQQKQKCREKGQNRGWKVIN